MAKNGFVFFLLALLAAHGTALGQATPVLRMAGVEASGKIVRNYENTGKPIVYYDEGTTCGFACCDPSSFNFKRFDIAEGLHVNDFRILGGKLYFCGYQQGGSAIVGWFDIDDVFSNGNVSYTVYHMPGNIPSHYWYDGRDSLLAFDRLRLYKDGGNVHLLMVGRGWNVFQGQFESNPWLVADFRIDQSGTVTLYYSMDYALMIAYDDLDIVNKKLIVTGHKTGLADGNNNEHSFTYYTLPDSPLFNIFQSYDYAANYNISVPMVTAPVAAYSGTSGYAERVLVTHLDGRRFATLCNGHCDDHGEGAMLTIYKSTNTILARRWFNACEDKPFREMVFNREKNRLVFIQDDPTGEIYHVDLDAAFSPSSSLGIVSTGDYKWRSLDEIGSTASQILSGHDSPDQPLLWMYPTLVSVNCYDFSSIEILPHHWNDILRDVEHAYIKTSRFTQPDTIHTELQEGETIIICE